LLPNLLPNPLSRPGGLRQDGTLRLAFGHPAASSRKLCRTCALWSLGPVLDAPLQLLFSFAPGCVQHGPLRCQN